MEGQQVTSGTAVVGAGYSVYAVVKAYVTYHGQTLLYVNYTSLMTSLASQLWLPSTFCIKSRFFSKTYIALQQHARAP